MLDEKRHSVRKSFLRGRTSSGIQFKEISLTKQTTRPKDYYEMIKSLQKNQETRKKLTNQIAAREKIAIEKTNFCSNTVLPL